MRLSAASLVVLTTLVGAAAAASRRAPAGSLRAADALRASDGAASGYKEWIHDAAGNDGAKTWKDLAFEQCGFMKGPVRGTSSNVAVGAGLWSKAFLRLTCTNGASSIQWREHASGAMGVTATGVVTMPVAEDAAYKDAWQCQRPRAAHAAPAAKGADDTFPQIYVGSRVPLYAAANVAVRCKSGWAAHEGCLCIKVDVENAARPFLRLHADGACTFSALAGKNKKARAAQKTLTKDELEQLLIDELNACKANGGAPQDSRISGSLGGGDSRSSGYQSARSNNANSNLLGSARDCTEAVTWPRRTANDAVVVPSLFPRFAEGSRGSPLLGQPSEFTRGAHMQALQRSTNSHIVNPLGDGNCFFASLALAELPAVKQGTVTAAEVGTAANTLRHSIVAFMRTLEAQPCNRDVFLTGAMQAVIDGFINDASTPDAYLAYLDTPGKFADQSIILPAAVALDACITVYDFPEPSCVKTGDPTFIRDLCDGGVCRVNIDAAIVVYGRLNKNRLDMARLDAETFLSKLSAEEATSAIYDIIWGAHMPDYDKHQAAGLAKGDAVSHRFGPFEADGRMACSKEIALVRDANHYALLQKD